MLRLLIPRHGPDEGCLPISLTKGEPVVIPCTCGLVVRVSYGDAIRWLYAQAPARRTAPGLLRTFHGDAVAALAARGRARLRRRAIARAA